MADFDTIADDINYYLDVFGDIIYAAWEDCLGGCNNGQFSIVSSYVFDAIDESLEQIGAEWPWGIGSDEYVFAMYNAYDSDVMYQAFSDTIESPVSELDEIQFEAQATDLISEIFGV